MWSVPTCTKNKNWKKQTCRRQPAAGAVVLTGTVHYSVHCTAISKKPKFSLLQSSRIVRWNPISEAMLQIFPTVADRGRWVFTIQCSGRRSEEECGSQLIHLSWEREKIPTFRLKSGARSMSSWVWNFELSHRHFNKHISTLEGIDDFCLFVWKFGRTHFPKPFCASVQALLALNPFNVMMTMAMRSIRQSLNLIWIIYLCFNSNVHTFNVFSLSHRFSLAWYIQLAKMFTRASFMQ